MQLASVSRSEKESDASGCLAQLLDRSGAWPKPQSEHPCASAVTTASSVLAWVAVHLQNTSNTLICGSRSPFSTPCLAANASKGNAAASHRVLLFSAKLTTRRAEPHLLAEAKACQSALMEPDMAP